jgi:hypothetical protein
MKNSIIFKKWSSQNIDTNNIDPIKIRDLIIECFHVSQGEMFKQTKQRLGFSHNDRDIYERVLSVVRLAFEKVNGDFHHPSKDDLTQVHQYLLERARSWGTPEDVLKHNSNEVLSLINKLD